MVYSRKRTSRKSNKKRNYRRQINRKSNRSKKNLNRSRKSNRSRKFNRIRKSSRRLFNEKTQESVFMPAVVNGKEVEVMYKRFVIYVKSETGIESYDTHGSFSFDDSISQIIFHRSNLTVKFRNNADYERTVRKLIHEDDIFAKIDINSPAVKSKLQRHGVIVGENNLFTNIRKLF